MKCINNTVSIGCLMDMKVSITIFLKINSSVFFRRKYNYNLFIVANGNSQ